MSTPLSRLGAAAVAAGLGVGLAAVPAEAAATYSVSVSAVDRDGKAVKPAAYLVNVKTGSMRTVRGGAKVRVGAGTYAVTTQVWNGELLTIGTRVVKVGKSQNVAFDARKGQRVRFSVDDPTAGVSSLNVLPLINGHQWSMNPIDGVTPANGTYVIPTSSKYVSLAAHAVLERKGATSEAPSPYRYDLIRVAKGGIPAKPVYGNKRADLARVDMSVRSFDHGQTGTLDLEATAPNDRSWIPPMQSDLGMLPRTLVSYRTPGLRWAPSIRVNGLYGNASLGGEYRLLKKAVYKETWGHAVWGPSRRGVDGSFDGERLYLMPRQLVCPPPRDVNENCELSGVTKSVKLYRGKTLVAQGKGDLRPKIPTKAAWYNLRVDARRPAGALLSTRVTGAWWFKARGYGDGLSHGGPRLLTVVFAPRGLDSRNHAGRGSTTPVPLTVQVGPDAKLTVKSLVVEASTDGGKSWRKLTVKREGKHWIVQVRNPNAAGFVSLRATAKDTVGATVVQTIQNAYGVR